MLNFIATQDARRFLRNGDPSHTDEITDANGKCYPVFGNVGMTVYWKDADTVCAPLVDVNWPFHQYRFIFLYSEQRFEAFFETFCSCRSKLRMLEAHNDAD